MHTLPETYITSAELIEILAISKSTLENLCKRGMPLLRVGKSRRFLLSDVQKWLKRTNGRRYVA